MVDAGLCGGCAHVRRVTSRRGSVFFLCRRAEFDVSFPRYPRLPVRECRGFTRAGSGRSTSPSLLEQRPFGAVVRLATPTTGVMLVGAVSNVLYTYFVSRLGSEAIAAVSLVFPVSLVMVTLMGGGLGAGVSSAIARALGARRLDEAKTFAEQALLITAAFTLIATVTLELGIGRLFAAMGGSGEVLRQATLFARILFGGVGITFLVATLDSILRGQGSVRVSALCGALSLGLQMVFTPLLMFVLDLGLIGAPIAALSGQTIGIIPRFRYVFGGRGVIRPRWFPGRVERRHILEILRVGIPSSLSALIHYVGMMVLTGVFARFGTDHLAAYGLCTRLDFVIFTLGYGVATAALTLVGMATGARRPDLAARYVRQSVLLAITAAALPSLFVLISPGTWIGLFTPEPGIHAVGAQYFRIIAPTYLFMVSSMVVASAFQGFGRATLPLATMSIRVGSVLLLAILLTRAAGASSGPVFVVIALGNVLSAILLATLFRRTMHKSMTAAVQESRR